MDYISGSFARDHRGALSEKAVFLVQQHNVAGGRACTYWRGGGGVRGGQGVDQCARGGGICGEV